MYKSLCFWCNTACLTILFPYDESQSLRLLSDYNLITIGFHSESEVDEEPPFSVTEFNFSVSFFFSCGSCTQMNCILFIAGRNQIERMQRNQIL